MRAPGLHRLILRPAEPEIRQEPINGFTISWNPDDSRFYVEDSEGVRATFNRLGWKNVVYYAKTHTPRPHSQGEQTCPRS